ncbi:hypothetical protein D3C72_2587370 [compost metagenome]
MGMAFQINFLSEPSYIASKISIYQILLLYVSVKYTRRLGTKGDIEGDSKRNEG